MRTINLRIWSYVNKRWSYEWEDFAPLWSVVGNNSNVFSLNRFGGEDYGYAVQQSTSIKDINNQDIYEGDLVQMRYANQPDIPESLGIYEVYYDERWAAFYLRVIKKNWFDGTFRTEKEAKKQTINPICPVSPKLTAPLGDFRICEIIGNIFENPELLKQE